MMKLGARRTVWQMAKKYLRNDKLRRVFSFQPLLVGGNPFNTTSIYSLIHFLEREYGVHFAMGGTGAIVEGLRRLMEEEGIGIRLDSEVAELLEATSWPTSGVVYAQNIVAPPRSSRDGITHVLMKNGEAVPVDLVVCNADAPYVKTHLIGKKHRQQPNWKYSMGLFVLYFGTTKQYPDVQHHTIILGEQYEKLLHEMFNMKKLEMSDFSIYLHRPTATDPSMAPAGFDCFYALVPVPNLQSDIDWTEMGPKYRDLVIDYLQRMALPGLKQCITSVSYVTPLFYRDELNTLHGTGFSIQPTFDQSAYFRFHNKSDDIKNLYFVGAGTHPGAGMPGVLCSAKVLEHVLPADSVK